MRFIPVGALVMMLLALTPAPAPAQQLDARWTPWLGCWQLERETVRVCVTPADLRGVALKTYVDNAAEQSAAAAVLEQTLVADGAPHPIAEAECRGHQTAEWSRSGERLFARAELSCNDGAVRKVSGLSMIAADGTWIDIQGIAIAGRENIRIRRYQRAAGRAAASQVRRRVTSVAPRLGPAPFTVADVQEAATRVSARVLQAALVETSAGFDLSGRIVRDLERGGVADSVIDTMVALSYPSHFIVDRPASQSSSAFGPVGFGDTSFGLWPSPYYGAQYGAPYGGYYDPYGSALWSPYFYSPFGYSYWGSYGSYLPYGSLAPAGFIAIGDDADRSDGNGRAIDGVGYTRIREREPERAAQPTDSSGTSSTSGGSSSPRGGGASGVSSGGYSGGSSGGSSGGDSGRTAQPR